MCRKTESRWWSTTAGIYTRLINGYDMKVQRTKPDEWEILGWNREHCGYVMLGIAHSYTAAKNVAKTLAEFEDPGMSRKPEKNHP